MTRPFLIFVSRTSWAWESKINEGKYAHALKIIFKNFDFCRYEISCNNRNIWRRRWHILCNAISNSNNFYWVLWRFAREPRFIGFINLLNLTNGCVCLNGVLISQSIIEHIFGEQIFLIEKFIFKHSLEHLAGTNYQLTRDVFLMCVFLWDDIFCSVILKPTTWIIYEDTW